MPSDQLPTTFPSNVPTESPTDVSDVPDLPSDFPTDLTAFPTTLPADWPAELQLPPDASVLLVESTDSGKSLTFEGTGSVEDNAAFFEAELAAAGYTKTDSTVIEGSYSGTFTKDATTVTVSMFGVDTQLFGAVDVGAP